jgi:hypothetical protein
MGLLMVAVLLSSVALVITEVAYAQLTGATSALQQQQQPPVQKRYP